MKRQLLTSVYSFLICYNGFCQSTSNDTNPSLTQYHFIFPKKVKLKLNDLINEIGSYPTVDYKAVGYGWTESPQYERFENLMSIATDSQLVKLTDFFNPTVKAYAFWALVIRHNINVRSILERHINDKQSFQLLSGCLSETKKINEWFFNLAKSVLTVEEIEKYSTIIKS